MATTTIKFRFFWAHIEFHLKIFTVSNVGVVPDFAFRISLASSLVNSRAKVFHSAHIEASLAAPKTAEFCLFYFFRYHILGYESWENFSTAQLFLPPSSSTQFVAFSFFFVRDSIASLKCLDSIIISWSELSDVMATMNHKRHRDVPVIRRLNMSVTRNVEQSRWYQSDI